jgi:2-polyprenyl-6-methoxyphenol hydroxylase-like FAD-dependent oxidoreductase
VTRLAPVGAGILLQPSGLAALAEIGCLPQLLRLGARIDRLHGVSSKRVIMQVPYTDLGRGPEVHGLGVHRGALSHVLEGALAGLPHERLGGCEVQAVEDRAAGVVVRFTRDGQQYDLGFDAALIANGSASTLQPRSLVRHNRRYPWGAMWTLRTWPGPVPELARDCLHQRYGGAQYMMGVLPTGSLPEAPDVPQFSFFWSLRVKEMEAWRTGAIDMRRWRDQVMRLWPQVAPLIEPLTSPALLVPAVYRHVILSQWGRGRIGVLGDAAHSMSPQLGQGANLALLDAVTLAEAVAAQDQWDSVWDTFNTARRGSIRFYQLMSRLLTPLYQSGLPAAGALRDIGMMSCRRVPWLRRQMALTVAGAKAGWLR